MHTRREREGEREGGREGGERLRHYKKINLL